MALLRRALLTAALAAFGAATQAQVASMTDVKVAFLYNFIVLSTWPTETPYVLRFCVAGAAEGMAQFSALSNKSAGERRVILQNAATPANAVACNILYIPPSESARAGAWLTAAARMPTLTVTDQSEIGGAIVNLRIANGKIVFDVDTRAAAAARIALSSQLIKLAATRQ